MLYVVYNSESQLRVAQSESAAFSFAFARRAARAARS